MKKLLLALDCSNHARKAAEYVAEIAPLIPGCEIHLCMISTGIPAVAEELSDASPVPSKPHELHGDDDCLREMEEIEAFFAEMKKSFMQRGMAEAVLHTSLRPLGRGIPHDLLDAAADRGCDTLVLGRRPLSKARTLIQGSVSASVIQHARGLAVWVVE